MYRIRRCKEGVKFDMAIIKFINNKVSLKKTINYICKEEKTKNKLITGINCTTENSYEEMMTVKRAYNKTGGREKIHFIQSFSPEDKIDYELAHKIALELIDMTNKFKSFQMVVATHQDTEHIHSHFVINTVDYIDGKKIQFSKKELEELKKYSNILCIKYGLSVTNEKSKVKDIKINEYKAMQKGTSWKSVLTENIDKVMEESKNRYDFFRKMNDLGYKVSWNNNSKYIIYITPQNYRCSDRQLHNEKYLKENMEKYFKEKSLQKINGYKKSERHTRYKSMSLSLVELIEQFKNRNNENQNYYNFSNNNASARKQYMLEMHYSLEEIDDMEM